MAGIVAVVEAIIPWLASNLPIVPKAGPRQSQVEGAKQKADLQSLGRHAEGNQASGTCSIRARYVNTLRTLRFACNGTHFLWLRHEHGWKPCIIELPSNRYQIVFGCLCMTQLLCQARSPCTLLVI